jgi:hypothetical protein
LERITNGDGQDVLYMVEDIRVMKEERWCTTRKWHRTCNKWWQFIINPKCFFPKEPKVIYKGRSKAIFGDALTLAKLYWLCPTKALWEHLLSGYRGQKIKSWLNG